MYAYAQYTYLLYYRMYSTCVHTLCMYMQYVQYLCTYRRRNTAFAYEYLDKHEAISPWCHILAYLQLGGVLCRPPPPMAHGFSVTPPPPPPISPGVRAKSADQIKKRKSTEHKYSRKEVTCLYAEFRREFYVISSKKYSNFSRESGLSGKLPFFHISRIWLKVPDRILVTSHYSGTGVTGLYLARLENGFTLYL